MNAIRQTQKLNKQELEEVIPPEASWHRDYADTAFIFIGGLPFELSEGDIITIFSQYGEPVFINLVRDKETGKSKGFCFLKYEDQRSCDLAVDNLGGATVMGRLLNVDHTRYKKRDDEEIWDNTYGGKVGGQVEGGVDGDDDETESEEERRPLLKEEVELAGMMRNGDDDDPMKAYMIKQKQEEVEVARMALVKRERKSTGDKHRRHKSHRSRRHGDSDHDERRERRRHKQRSRSRESDHGHSSNHHRRSLSTTPVYNQDEDISKPKERRRERSYTPVRRSDSPRNRRRERSRTPIYHSDDDSSGRKRKRERSLLRDRRR
ncbi:RNA-binding domain-containing protein [Tothia fuscella]|uniref:RNA-binding domain-containing protein n=1 Tax=Tothia fuscella TaxID=1048955 RepID=A0A9P4NW79_9PEZI|nr:RNA-binding domain-containing protein [Tothia fuscella]